MDPRTPHFLRFARALALVSGLGPVAGCDGPATTTPTDRDAASPLDADTPLDASATLDTGARDDGGTLADAPDPTGDANTTPDDAAVTLADASTVPDDTGPPAFDCTSCACLVAPDVDAGIPDCFAISHSECCIAVGPLAPPDLPA